MFTASVQTTANTAVPIVIIPFDKATEIAVLFARKYPNIIKDPGTACVFIEHDMSEWGLEFQFDTGKTQEIDAFFKEYDKQNDFLPANEINKNGYGVMPVDMSVEIMKSIVPTNYEVEQIVICSRGLILLPGTAETTVLLK